MRSNSPFVNNVTNVSVAFSALGSLPRWVVMLCLLLASPWGHGGSEAGSQADVRVLVDISGSMKKTDPANLRQPSLALLLQLLPESSRAGVWTFGEGVNPLVAYGDVTGDWKRRALDLSRNIGSSDLFTHLGAALDQAAFDRHQPRDRPVHILLLTDGMVDIDKDPQRNDAERQRIVQQLLPQLKAAGYTVHTIALSNHADRELLDQLALATGGVAAEAHNADTLMKAFLRLFDQTAPAEQLPLTDNRFWVDDSIEEFTALVFRRPGSQPTRLIDPANNIHHYPARGEPSGAGVSWYRTEHYDLITIPRPQPGEWHIVADVAPESRVTIVSNLNLSVEQLPHQVYVQQALGLSFRLQEQGGTVTDPAFLDVLDIYGELVHEVEEQGAGVERWQSLLNNNYSRSSGVYQTRVEGFSTAGDYRLTVVVDGKTFQRQFTHYVQARTPGASAAAVQDTVIPHKVAVNQVAVNEGAANQVATARNTPAQAVPELPTSVTTDRPPPVESALTRPKQPPADWVLYAILGGGNLLLLVVGLIVYRMIMGRGQQVPQSSAEDAETEAPADNEPILPIELDVEPVPQSVQAEQPQAPVVSKQSILDEQEVDALFAELDGNWNNNPAQDKA